MTYVVRHFQQVLTWFVIKEFIQERSHSLDEDPLSIKMEAKNDEETMKHEIEDIQGKNSDDDGINTINIVHH